MKNLTLIQQKNQNNSRPRPTKQEIAKARELEKKFAKIERDIKDALTFTRKTKREIAQTIASVLQLKKAPYGHYENGKTVSDMEIYDDSYSFACKTPGFPGVETDVLVYFLKTNEKGILFVSEVSVLFGDLLEEYLDTDTNTDGLLLSGEFTVNENGKTVRFAKGNLFWNGSEFALEENQFDYPTSWNPNHVGHFHWSKDAAVARAEKCYDPEKTTKDSFFAADGRAIEGLTVLTIDEWQYLFENSLHSHNGKFDITIDGKHGAVLKPDGFSGSINDEYTLDEWAAAEAEGLVFLPFASFRYVTNVDCVDDHVSLWTSTPHGRYEGFAGGVSISSCKQGVTNETFRYGGYSVRLVGLV